MENKNSIPQTIFYNLTAKLPSAVLVIWVLGTIFSFQPALAANALLGQESVIIARTNTIRAEVGLPALTMDSRLMQSAAAKANDMAVQGYFAHANPDGYRMAYWINNAGYTYTLAGENIAKGFHSADRLMNAWVASPSHYKNLTETKFTNIGIGIAEGWYENQMTTFVVQHFGVEATPAAKEASQLTSTATSLIAPLIESVAGATDQQASLLSQTYPTPVPANTPVITQPAPTKAPTSPANLTSTADTKPALPTSTDQVPVATWPIWVVATLAGLVYLLDIELVLLLRRQLVPSPRRAIPTRVK